MKKPFPPDEYHLEALSFKDTLKGILDDTVSHLLEGLDSDTIDEIKSRYSNLYVEFSELDLCDRGYESGCLVFAKVPNTSYQEELATYNEELKAYNDYKKLNKEEKALKKKIAKEEEERKLLEELKKKYEGA